MSFNLKRCGAHNRTIRLVAYAFMVILCISAFGMILLIANPAMAAMPGYVFDAWIENGKFVSALNNNTDNVVTGNFYLAVYDSADKLVYAERQPFTAVEKSIRIEFETDFTVYFDEFYHFKAFCWDLNNIPLTGPISDFSLPTAASRQQLNFNMGWKFVKAEPEGPNDHKYLFSDQNPESIGFDDSTWTDVNLPHSVNDEDAFSKFTRAGKNGGIPDELKILDTDGTPVTEDTHEGQREMYTGKMWYRKHFSIPAEKAGKKVFIEFEAARQAAEVWLNGVKLVGKYENGFIPFGYDLTPYIKYGEDNVIAVLVDNTFPYRTTEFGEWTPANKNNYILVWHDSHWHPTYGGLYRNVNLFITDPLHITLPLYSFLATQGTYVYTEKETVNLKSVGVSAEAEIINEYDQAKTFEYEAVIYDMDGRIVESKSTTVSLPAGKKTSDIPESENISDGRVFIKFEMTNPTLWSPDYPYLYNVVTNVKLDGTVVDTTDTPLGIRIWDFSYDYGFQINGYNLKLKGWGQKSTNEWPGLASALPDWLEEYTIQQMKDAGGNYIRWGHSAGSPSQIDISNKLGMITCQPGVEGEANTSVYTYADANMRVRIAAWQDMLIYFRNNPCILLWEYGNGLVPTTTDMYTGQTNNNVSKMYDLIQKWDPKGNRDRTARDNSGSMLPYMTVVESTDGGSQGRSNRFPILESEYDRSEAPRRAWDKYTEGYQDYTTIGLADFRDWTSEDLTKYAVQKWQYMNNSFHAGGANWIFSDSTSHGRTFSDVSRTSGEVDAVRLEKDAYYALQTMWSDKPSIFIIGHWNYKPGTRKTINVVSTAAKVELYVNGALKATNTAPRNRNLFEFENIDWESGEVKAVGYLSDGSNACEYVIETHGEPVALRMTTHESPGGIKAGGDVLLIDIEAVDTKGRRCLTFDAKIGFDVSQFTDDGTGIWLGGYNSGFENTIRQKDLYIEAGVNRVSIRSTDKAGPITLGAEIIGIGTAQRGKELTPGSGGVAPVSVTVISKSVDNTNGISKTMPEIYGLDLNGMTYNGFGMFDGSAPPVEDPFTSALIKDLTYTGFNGASSMNYEAYARNPAAQDEYAYNDWNKRIDAEERLSLKFGKLPLYLINSDYIYAPNDDADSQSLDFIRFNAGRDINVYVAHDDRILEKPTWLTNERLVSELKGFIPTGDKIKIGNYTYSVYCVQVDKGESINLGSNKENPNDRGNLMVVFAKERRTLNEFLYDDFEMQNVNADPEGWYLSVPGNRTVKVETLANDDNPDNKAIHMVDKTTGSYALTSRKFSPFLTGKYSIKWKVYENTTGNTRLSYQRVILHDGPPMPDAGTSTNYMIETYLDGGRFTYRLIGGNATTGTSQNSLGPVLEQRKWHEIELIVNMDKKTYDVVINGTTYGTSIAFTSSSMGKKIDYIIMGTRSGGADNDIFYDDIIITPLFSLELDPIAEQTVEAGVGYEINAPITFAPNDAELVAVSDDLSVATAGIVGTGVGRTVEITGVSLGDAMITVTATDDQGRSTSTSFTVNVVTPKPPTISKPDDITGINAGSYRTTTVNYGPVTGTVVSAASSDINVAMADVVSQVNGTASLRITGASAGTVRITVTAARPGNNTASSFFDVTVTGGSTAVVTLLDINFDGLPTGSFDITGPSLTQPVPNPLLPELTRILAPASSNSNIVDIGNGNKYFTLHSNSADTKAVYSFEPVTEGTLSISFKWLPDPNQISASIAIIGGTGNGSAASDCAFTIIKQNATEIAYRTGGTANTPNTVITGYTGGKWIDVKIEMNVTAQTYKLWIDGIQMLFNTSEDIPYRYPISTGNGAIWGITVGKANGVNATVCIDDIKVTMP